MISRIMSLIFPQMQELRKLKYWFIAVEVTHYNCRLHALKAKFMEASNFPSMLGLRDFASFDEQGNNYTDPKFPFRLVFQPLKDLKTK
jgi:hypothetical protein